MRHDLIVHGCKHQDGNVDTIHCVLSYGEIRKIGIHGLVFEIRQKMPHDIEWIACPHALREIVAVRKCIFLSCQGPLPETQEIPSIEAVPVYVLEGALWG